MARRDPHKITRSRECYYYDIRIERKKESMTKVGKTLNHMTDTTMKAGGVVTKKTGEFMADACKAMGIKKDTCEKMEDKADELGKDMYCMAPKWERKSDMRQMT